MFTKRKRQFRLARPTTTQVRPKRAAYSHAACAPAASVARPTRGSPRMLARFCIKVLALVSNIVTSKPTVTLVSA
jgi:hypothetical protein